MTPEQKAFLEYGESIQKLKEAWRFVREFPMPRYLKATRYTDKYIPDLDSKEFRSFMDFLSDARQKQKECRKWKSSGKMSDNAIKRTIPI